MAGVQEPGLAHRGVEPRALVEEFLLLEARRSSEDNASASGSREPTPSHSPSPLAYAARKVACWTCPGAEESAIGGPEQPSVSTRMMETLPKLYEYECDRHVAVRRTFLPLTVTDELGQRYIAYSLLEPLEGGEADHADSILILVAVSKLKRCFSGMRHLLEALLRAIRSDPSVAAGLMSWVGALAPYPLPGLAYEVVCAFGLGGGAENATMVFANPAPSNFLPRTLSVQFYKLVQILGVHGLFRVWVAALLEQRILMVTRKRGPLAATYLTVCAEALLMLLEPLKWQGIYVPFVPRSMAVLVEAPTPYVMGVSEPTLRDAELDDGIVEVNIDNGRIRLPDNMPAVPESLETKLDAVDATLDDPMQRGLGVGGQGVAYGSDDLLRVVSEVRRCFAGILCEIVENTKKLSQNGARSIEDIRGLARGGSLQLKSRRGRRFSVLAGDQDLSPGGDGSELTKGYSFSQTPDVLSSKKKQSLHRRSVSWDFQGAQHAAMTPSNNPEAKGEDLKFDFIPDTESYEESLYFYEEFFQTQIFQDFLANGWPPNWPACALWPEREMERRHSANDPRVRFRLDLEETGDMPASVEGVVEKAMAAFAVARERAAPAATVEAEVGGKWEPVALGASPSDQADLPRVEAGETVATLASFSERLEAAGLGAPDAFLSPAREAGRGDAVLSATRPPATSVGSRFDHLDYYEKALEVGVQSYACVPVARLYRLLRGMPQAERTRIESRLGPNLCMLLEQVRMSDGDSREAEEEEGEGSSAAMVEARAGGEDDLCPTLTATAAQGLSSLRASDGQRPLNLLGGGAGGEVKELKQPEEAMLVCISTVKMLLTIQANKNNNKVRQYIDANDIAEVAESAEYDYFNEATAQLARVDPSTLPQKQRVVFFINLYNLMVLHAALEKARSRKKGDSKLRWLPKASPFGWMKFLRSATYNVGGNVYSALDVEHSILRSSRPYNDDVFIGRLLPYFKDGDPRNRCKVNQQIPLLTFALCPGTSCSPPLKCFHGENFENELLSSAQTYLARYTHTRKRSDVLEVRLPLLLKWYRHDLGHGSGNKWLVSIANLIRGSKVSKAILEAVDNDCKVVVKYDTYKWELGWMLQES